LTFTVNFFNLTQRGCFSKASELGFIMPANLPPEYFEAERRYRAAKMPADKIACLEELLTITPKHKGTDKMRAGLRKRISKLKSSAQVKKSLGKRDYMLQDGDVVELQM
jgi:hypothetical protein